MSRILITGAAGLLGQNLVGQLLEKHHLQAVDKTANPFDESCGIDYLQADLTSFESIRPTILAFGPEYIFNCAALTDVDRCETERELADKLNFELVNHLLSIPVKKIIHYSSDYVFDGSSGPYKEDDRTEPINYYGLTKLHSENILMNSGVDYLIIRTNVLFGIAIGVKNNFVSWVKESLERGESISVVDDQFNNPTLASNLAKASVEVAFNDTKGILHISGDQYLSRYQAALIIAEHHKLDTNLIRRSTSSQISQKAKRPLKGGLVIDKAKAILKIKLIPFTESYVLIANKL